MNKRFWLEDEKRWITLRVSARGMRLIDKLGLPAVVARAPRPRREALAHARVRAARGPTSFVLAGCRGAAALSACSRAAPARVHRVRRSGRRDRRHRCAASPATARSRSPRSTSGERQDGRSKRARGTDVAWTPSSRGTAGPLARAGDARRGRRSAGPITVGRPLALRGEPGAVVVALDRGHRRASAGTPRSTRASGR